MLFKELPQGKIFEVINKDGHTLTAIKTGERYAIALANGEEIKIHPNKKVDLQRAMRPGEFAIENETGKPLIVEKIKNGQYWGEYILRVGGTTFAESQVSVYNRHQGETRQDFNEVYIILKRAKKAVEQAEKALIMVEDMIEDIRKIR